MGVDGLMRVKEVTGVKHRNSKSLVLHISKPERPFRTYPNTPVDAPLNGNMPADLYQSVALRMENYFSEFCEVLEIELQ